MYKPFHRYVIDIITRPHAEHHDFFCIFVNCRFSRDAEEAHDSHGESAGEVAL
jgi:hypothetical protein